jgi:hypothetical protein
MRVGAAAVVLVLAVAGALVLQEHRLAHHFAACANGMDGSAPCIRYLRPSWVDPAAFGIVFLGLAAASFFISLNVGRSLAAPILVIGAALVGASVLHGQRAYMSTSCISGGEFPSFFPCIRERGWADPTALGICIVGLAGATALLLTGRRSQRSD